MVRDGFSEVEGTCRQELVARRKSAAELPLVPTSYSSAFSTFFGPLGRCFVKKVIARSRPAVHTSVSQFAYTEAI